MGGFGLEGEIVGIGHFFGVGCCEVGIIKSCLSADKRMSYILGLGVIMLPCE